MKRFTIFSVSIYIAFTFLYFMLAAPCAFAQNSSPQSLKPAFQLSGFITDTWPPLLFLGIWLWVSDYFARKM